MAKTLSVTLSHTQYLTIRHVHHSPYPHTHTCTLPPTHTHTCAPFPPPTPTSTHVHPCAPLPHPCLPTCTPPPPTPTHVHTPPPSPTHGSDLTLELPFTLTHPKPTEPVISQMVTLRPRHHPEGKGAEGGEGEGKDTGEHTQDQPTSGTCVPFARVAPYSLEYAPISV